MNSSNGIIRVEKHTKKFVVINKNFLEDKRISFKAKGILTYLLSKPDNWQVMTSELIEASSDGEAAVRSALKELEKYGYYKKYPVRTENGTKIDHWESLVYESPQDEAPEQSKAAENKADDSPEKSDSLFCGFPKVENQLVGNPALINNYLLNNDFNKSTTTSSSSFKDNNKTARDRARTKTTGKAAGKSSVGKGYAAKARVIKKQIGYDQFVTEGSDMELIDKIVEYLAGYYARPTRLQQNGVPIPEETAKKYFDLLDHVMLTELIEKYESIRCQIDVQNERSYILVMLYDMLKNPTF